MITKISIVELKNVLVELESHILIPKYEQIEIKEFLIKIYGNSEFHKVVCYHHNEYDDCNYDYTISRIELYNKEGLLIEPINDDSGSNNYYAWSSDYGELISLFDSISPWKKENVPADFIQGKGIMTFYFDDVPQLKIPNFYIDYNL